MSSTTASETTTQATLSAATGTKLTGRVKWFNNSAGYGFITVTDGDKAGADIFVHHSAIVVKSEQYKYLVQGEYVSLSLATTTEKSAHDVQAADVSGINGGLLMCETRREVKSSHIEHSSIAKPETKAVVPKSRAAPKDTEKDAPVKAESKDAAWTYAGKAQGKGGRGSASTRGGRGGRGGRGPKA
jgi:CspA family cold shock protein